MKRPFASRSILRSLIVSALVLNSATAIAQTAEAAPTEAAPTEAAPTEAPPAVEAAPAAETKAPAAAETAPEVPSPAAAKPKPPPYSLPWQLRPVVAGTVLRSDTAFAFYENPTTEKSGSTIASTLLFSYKIGESFAPLVRLGVVSNSPPDAAAPAPQSATHFMNPVLGGTYAIKLSPELRLAFFLGLTIPVGGGGGNKPDVDNAAANAAGIRARSAMDNAMFAVNDFTVFPGVGFAYLAGGFTAQVEATVLQLTRVRGEDVQKDSSKTNFTTGLHLGYFIVPFLSVGAEIRHQRWLSTPKTIQGNAAYSESTLRDTTTFAVGPRVHLKLGEKMWFRPGIAFAMGLDDPMKDAKYKIVQLDLPIAF